MKKILSILCCLFILTAITTLCVGASTITYTFRTEDEMNSWISDYSKTNMTKSFDSDYNAMKVVTIGTDPNFTHNFTSSTYIDTNTYKYVHYRFKIIKGEADGLQGQFFVSTTKYSGFANHYINFDIKNTTQWQDYFKDYTSTEYWSGDLKAFRLDPTVSSGITLIIDSVSFCSTLEEVKALQDETAAMNNVTYKFDTAEKVKNWFNNYENNLTYSFDEENKAVAVTVTGNDPYFVHNFNSDYKTAKSYKYVHYRFKIVDGTSDKHQAQFFFTTSNDTNYDGTKNIDLDIKDTASWQDCYANFSSNTKWTGRLTGFRIDPIQQGTFSEMKFLIDSVSFCSTMEQVEALQAETKAMNGPTWTFDTYDNVKQYLNKTNFDQLDYNDENGYLALTPNGTDPKFNMSLSEEKQFDADTFKYIAFRMKADTTLDVGSLFYKNADYTYNDTRTNFDVYTDNEWHNYVINMSSDTKWTGTITDWRFDFVDHFDDRHAITLSDFVNSKIIVDRIGVFRTEAEANEFLNKEIVCNIDFPWTGIINSGAETPCWDFTSNPEAQNEWLPGGGYWGSEHGISAFTPSTNDGTLTKTFIGDRQFDADEFKYLAVRIKNTSSQKLGILFFTDEVVESFNDDNYVKFNFTKNGTNAEWENIVVNAKQQFPETWTGKISSVRLDPANPTDIGSTIYISRVGFFRSEADAIAFLEAADDTPDYSLSTVFKSELQRSVVPGGTIQSSAYKRSDYLLSSTTPVGEGENPLVKYTDSDGDTSVVALSDVNSAGYTRFAAQKAGTYTIGYNPKEYTDIENHWAKEYIDYVSDREILSGISTDVFAPDMPMTRGMFAKALANMDGLDASAYDGVTDYTDVNSTEYYAPYIQWAVDKGYMSPVTDTTFEPENAISRIDIAVALANYINTHKYSYSYYNDTQTFDDLKTYSDDVIAAVELLQEWGIMSGISDTAFAPTAILTRAEVAEIFRDTVKALTGAALPKTEYTNTDITKKRIRLGVWGFAFSDKVQVDYLRDLGANLIVTGGGAGSETVWNLCDKYGIEVFMQDYNLYGKSKDRTDESGNKTEDKVTDTAGTTKTFTYKDFDSTKVDLKKMTAEYIDHPSFGGHYFTDEPGTYAFDWMGDAIDHYNEYFPDKTAFINLLPMYANAAQLKYGASADKIAYYNEDTERYKQYCEKWFETNNADYICTDIYPLNWDEGKKVTSQNYLEWINVIASVAREHDKEFWCCIQTFGWNSGKRTPNEAEFRWQAYSMLSYGATGILLWSYTNSSEEFQSMIDMRTLERNQSYFDCQPVFAEMNKISDVYIQYKNLGAFVENSDYLWMSNEYDVANTVFNEIKCDAPLLFGYFKKEVGTGNAFTVVNLTDFEGNDDTSTTLKFTLDDMSKTVTSYYRGEPKVLTAQDGYYSITLKLGDGAFVTID